MSPFLAVGLVYGLKVFCDCGSRLCGGEVVQGVDEVGGLIQNLYVELAARWAARLVDGRRVA